MKYFVVNQENQSIMLQVLNKKIRDDVVKKYAQYTKRVNGEMIKGSL